MESVLTALSIDLLLYVSIYSDLSLIISKLNFLLILVWVGKVNLISFKVCLCERV